MNQHRIRFARLTGMAALAAALVGACAHTPPVETEDGTQVPGSIATMERVELNGTHQWITVRGHDESNPILLFLAGGPGGSELPSTRLHLSGLEETYLVVNWDQPGAAKSFRSVPFDELTPRRYVEDAVALVDLLLDRYGERQVYLVGESWGSMLGIWLCQEIPDRIAAFVGSGQMVTFTENDVAGYEFAIRLLKDRGEHGRAAKLREMGPPPYTDGNLSLTYMQYLDVLNGYMHARVDGEGADVDILRDALRAPEYSLRDRVNWIRGLMKVFNTVYPQLQGVDLRRDAPVLDVPVYMVVGRHDVNAMPSFVEEYYDLLEAPRKELVWFEHSGHPPLYSEATRFVELMERVQRENPARTASAR